MTWPLLPPSSPPSLHVRHSSPHIQNTRSFPLCSAPGPHSCFPRPPRPDWPKDGLNCPRTPTRGGDMERVEVGVTHGHPSAELVWVMGDPVLGQGPKQSRHVLGRWPEGLCISEQVD